MALENLDDFRVASALRARDRPRSGARLHPLSRGLVKAEQMPAVFDEAVEIEPLFGDVVHVRCEGGIRGFHKVRNACGDAGSVRAAEG